MGDNIIPLVSSTPRNQEILDQAEHYQRMCRPGTKNSICTDGNCSPWKLQAKPDSQSEDHHHLHNTQNLCGLETVYINITNMEKLELFSRDLLKDVKGLPKNTTMGASNNSLRCTFIRQLAVKGSAPSSWIIQTRCIAQIYDLSKTVLTAPVHQAGNTQWQSKLIA